MLTVQAERAIFLHQTRLEELAARHGVGDGLL
jgi:hypothetical protein